MITVVAAAERVALEEAEEAKAAAQAEEDNEY